MNLRVGSIVLSFVVLVVGGPAFAQRVGSYNTAPKVTTAIENSSGSITLTYAAIPYKSGSTFTAMSGGTYPKQYLEMHRGLMKRMATLNVTGTDFCMGECKLEPGWYQGGFDVADDGKWSLVFFQGDKEMFREPVEMQKSAGSVPCLVLGLMPSTEKGCVSLAIHYGPNSTVLTMGANMMGAMAAKPAMGGMEMKKDDKTMSK